MTTERPDRAQQSLVEPNDFSPLGHLLVSEQKAWSDWVHQNLDPAAWLVYVSPLDSDRRIFRYGDRVAKVVRRRGTRRQLQRWHGQLLSHEFRVLSHLDSCGIRYSPHFDESADWLVLTMDSLEGRRFSDEWNDRSPMARLSLLRATIAAIEQLHRAGVRHGDIVASNILVERSGNVRLVDFGNAEFKPPFAARVRDYAKLLLGRHGLVLRLGKRLVLRLFPRAQGIYRKAKQRHLSAFSMDIADESEAEPFRRDLEVLERAWCKAARWNSGRGQWLCYSSLTVAGVHFSGWRPWLLRWNRISGVVDFRDKSVVDLGCNIGLLTSFAMLYGARSAKGIESDASLVAAAREVADAFDVAAEFQQLDLASPRAWETELGNFDIVVALSIMEWVGDRQRLLRYIGTHREVLYEGHDPLEIECERLRSVGFTRIEVVMVSEAGRPVLYGEKR